MAEPGAVNRIYVLPSCSSSHANGVPPISAIVVPHEEKCGPLADNHGSLANGRSSRAAARVGRPPFKRIEEKRRPLRAFLSSGRLRMMRASSGRRIVLVENSDLGFMISSAHVHRTDRSEGCSMRALGLAEEISFAALRSDSQSIGRCHQHDGPTLIEQRIGRPSSITPRLHRQCLGPVRPKAPPDPACICGLPRISVGGGVGAECFRSACLIVTQAEIAPSPDSVALA